MIKFQKYNSIENSYRQLFVDKCDQLGCKSWVVTEKVHGANFSFITDGVSVRPASRNGILGSDEEGNYNFYGCSPVVKRYASSIKYMYQEEFNNSSLVQVYGELCGQGIQKNVNYGEKDFVVFDIKVDGVFLDWDLVVSVCNHSGLMHAPEIARGSLSDMLEVTPEFLSIVAAWSDGVCKAEGVVIKPIDGSIMMGEVRPILKNKSKDFSEKSEKTPKKPTKISEDQEGILSSFLGFVNTNRIRSVLSKTGVPSVKEFGKVQGLLIQDAKQDFENDLYSISDEDWKAIRKVINREVSAIIRPHWLNIIDNNF